MTESIIFYALLTSQLVLMSFYFPRRIHQRMQTAFYTYTPDQYPRLYPKPASYYERLHQNYRLANQLLLILGCSVMMAMLAIDFDLSAKHAQMVPWAIFMIQMMPQMMIYCTQCIWICCRMKRKYLNILLGSMDLKNYLVLKYAKK